MTTQSAGPEEDLPNAPETIGTHVSSGCIRLTNEDVADLYARVNVGTRVIVLPMDRRAENS